MLRFGPRPVWVYFISFGAALTLPIMAVVGYMMWTFAKSERARLEGDAGDVNKQIVFALERQHSADMAALRALAASPTLRDDNIDAFGVQAAAIVKSDAAFADIILRNSAGQVLIKTGTSSNRDLPPDFLRPHTAPPKVSDISVSETFKQSAYYISTPAIVAGEVRYYLIARMALPRLTALIQEQMLNPGYFASIIDGSGIILARSAESEKHFGKKLNGIHGNLPLFQTWNGVNPQGVSVYGVLRRSQLLGWGVTTGISHEMLHEPIRRSLQWIIALAFATFAIGYLIAYLLSRVLSNAVARIVDTANDLGEGKLVGAPVTPVTEANIVGKALQTTSEKLRQHAEALSTANRTLEGKIDERTAELAAKTRMLEMTLTNMDQGLLVISSDQRLCLFNDNFVNFTNLSADLLKTQPTVTEAIDWCLANGVYQTVPDDVAMIAKRDTLVPGETIIHERERPDGHVIEVRTVPLADGSLVRTYTDVTLRKHAERHLQYLARHDTLTQLPNRLFFQERLEQAIAYDLRHGAPFSVLFIDLDHFKQINDRYGHATGDALLMEVSARFKSALRMEDTVARLGGDEFAILQTGAGATGDPIQLARRLLDAVAGSYRIADIEVATGISIGIARCPDHATSADRLLKKADMALYQAKRQGRGTFCLAAPDEPERKAS